MNPLANYEYRELTKNITIISTAENSMYMYLVKGVEQDILIDTGYGFGDLLSVIRKISDKEIIVINTHGHPDHVGSNNLFNTVYQSPNAKKDFREAFGKKINSNYEINEIKDGKTVEIAGINLTFWECPSHSYSDVIILEERDRVLFAGDIIDPEQVLFVEYDDNKDTYIDRIKLHLDSMNMIKNISDKFDMICPSHNGTPVEKSYLDGIIELDKKVINGTAKVFPLNHKYIEMNPLSNTFVRVRDGKYSIIYRDPRLIRNN